MNIPQIATFADVCKLTGFQPMKNPVGIFGQGWAELRDEDGHLKELAPFENLVTNIGDNYYGERASSPSNNTAPVQVTGMKLGTGTTAAAKSGAGAAIVTYVTAVTASKAIDATYPQSTHAVPGCQVQFKTTWNAGEATTSGSNWAEVVISNQTSLADSAGTAADTISRALISPTINKAAGDTLAVIWNHVLLGA